MSKLTCNKCLETKTLDLFHRKGKNKDGVRGMCKKCELEYQREYRKLVGNNKSNSKYEKTLKGKVVRTYRNMLSRVKGVLKLKSHLYEGLQILPKEEFYEWSLNNEDYLRIHKNWVKSDFDLKCSPSIDRKDTNLGYTLDNMRWVTHSENSRMGAINRNSL